MRTEVRKSKAWKGRKPRSSGRTLCLSEVRNRGKGTVARRGSKTAPIRPRAETTFGEASARLRGDRPNGAQFGEPQQARAVLVGTEWPQSDQVHSEADISGR